MKVDQIMAPFQLLIFDSRRGNVEGREVEKLLGFYPESTPAAERISLAGLIQGLHMFSGNFRPPQNKNKFEIIETDSSIWATFEAEAGIFLAIVTVKTWLPRHVSQENLFCLLLHIHHLMITLFCGVQYMLDKDETAQLVRGHISSVLNSTGNELNNANSWVSRELRNPFTTLGRAGSIYMPVNINLDAQSLCHRAQTVEHYDVPSIESCVLFYNRAVLWSVLDQWETAELCSLVHSSVFAVKNDADAGTGLGTLRRHLHQLDNGFIVLRPESIEGEETSRTLYSLPYVYSNGTMKYLMIYSKSDVLLFLLVDQSTVTREGLTILSGAIEPMTSQLLGQLISQPLDEIGHVPGWRYTVHDMDQGSRGTPRKKISAMSHHGRALATAVSDSMTRLGADSSFVEVYARSVQGIWAVGQQIGRREEEKGGVGASNVKRRTLIVKDKGAVGDAAQSIMSIENSLQSLGFM